MSRCHLRPSRLVLTLALLVGATQAADVQTILRVGATDDGLPNPPATLTYTWTRVSGPTTNVTFTPQTLSSADTTAGYTNKVQATIVGAAAGTYVFRATVSDSSLSAQSDVTVTVVSQDPTISAITNQTTTTGTAVNNIAVTVADNDSTGTNAAAALTLSATSSNTALLPVGSITFGGSGTSRTVSLAPNPNQIGTSTVVVTATDANGRVASTNFTLTVTDPFAPGVVMYSFDAVSGVTVPDDSGNGRTGTLTGNAVATSTGRSGPAATFDGVGDYVVNNSGTFLNGLSAVTVSAWVKSNVTSTDRGFLFAKDPDNTDSILSLRYDAAGTVGTGTNVIKGAITSTGGVQSIESASNVQTTNWQHIAMVWTSGQQLKLYINGALSTPTGNNAATTGTITGATKLLVGQGGRDNLTTLGWNGLVDDVRIYNRALSAGEVTSLYSQMTNIDGFVSRLYTQALGRSADAGGLAYWNGQLYSRAQSGAAVTYGFLYSAEYNARNTTNDQFINIMYQSFFNRAPDSGGYATWMAVLTGGGSRDVVYDGFASATEFTNLCNSYNIAQYTNSELRGFMVKSFVRRMYQKLLVREPDAGGYSTWSTGLLNGSSYAANLVSGFTSGAEFTNRNLNNTDFVTALYRACFNREPDSGGLNSWVTQLNGGTSRATVVYGFTHSAEFVNLCASYNIVAYGAGG
jgi:hypothetical protein